MKATKVAGRAVVRGTAVVLVLVAAGCARSTADQDCAKKDDLQEKVLLAVWPQELSVDMRDFGACDSSGDPLAIVSPSLDAAALAHVKRTMAAAGWSVSEGGDMEISKGGRRFIAEFLDDRFLAVSEVTS